MLSYVNGEYVPIEDAKVSIRDRGFTLGDGIFEGWRTFDGRACRPMVEKHLERMRKSLRYMEQLDSDAIVDEVDEVTEALVKKNYDEIMRVGDVFVHTVVTRGVGDEEEDHVIRPTIASSCFPLDHQRLVTNYSNGVRLVPSMMSRNPYLPNDPRVKGLSRLALTRQERKQVREGGSTWVVSFDNQGFITEATTAGLCIIEGTKVITPPRWQILGSVSMQTFCELASDRGYELVERPLALYDFLNADEAHLLSTTLGSCWIAEIDGIPLRGGRAIGEEIRRAWFELVGLDFVRQAYERAQQVLA